MLRFHRLSIPLLIALIVGLIWWVERETPPAPVMAPAPGSGSHIASGGVRTMAPVAAEGERDERRVAPRPDGVRLIPDGEELARQLDAGELSPAEELEALYSLVTLFRGANGGQNPGGGLNEEFVDGLRGKNSRRVAVLPTTLRRLNDLGQIVDRWGAPYYFHPVSATKLQIRSAGPDGRLWTADDIADEPLTDSVPRIRKYRASR